MFWQVKSSSHFSKSIRWVKFFNFLTFEDGDVLAPHAALEVRVAKLIAAGAVGEAKGEVAFAMNLIVAFAMNLIMYLTAV